MRSLLLASSLAAVAVMASSSLAALAVSYDATGSPGSDPDGNSSLGGPANVWEFSRTDPFAGSFLAANFDGNNNVWAIYDTNNFGGSTATHTFAGGPLTAGQTLSIDYGHNFNINTGSRIGIRLLDASNNTQTEFSFLGGGNDFQKADNGGGFSNTGKQYDQFDLFTVTYEIGSGGAYTATATSGVSFSSSVGSWSGTVLGSLAKIQFFTDGGDNSDQYFDNLSITAVPEVTPFLTFSLLGGLFATFRPAPRVRQ